VGPRLVWTICREEKTVAATGIPTAVRQIRSLVVIENTVVGINCNAY